uniref:Interferon gamma n=1 Tax=Acrobeloides nanus TaxID=290746 RepID=A0A914DAX0_9BILA
VLSKHDLAALTFVINKIDPDRLFAMNGCALPQRNLVQLLDRLSQKLDTDTDLKFRYLEGAMENLHNDDPALKEKTKIALEKLSQRLDAFLTSDMDGNSVHKRHARLLKQLVGNQLRSA